MIKIVDKYYVWDKGDGDRLTPHFHSSEFECKCSYNTCKQQKLSISLIAKLESSRVEDSCPYVITSGYRCTRHQSDLTNDPKFETVLVSQHELGQAADLKVPSPQLRTLAILAKRFDAIGIAPTWFHVDERIGFRRWRYKA